LLCILLVFQSDGKCAVPLRCSAVASILAMCFVMLCLPFTYAYFDHSLVTENVVLDGLPFGRKF
jgi:hypothetical protein